MYLYKVMWWQYKINVISVQSSYNNRQNSLTTRHPREAENMSATKAGRISESFSKADISKDVLSSKSSLRYRRNQNLVKSVCEKGCTKILVLGSHLGTRI